MCRTGFSRESVRRHTAELMVLKPTSSRLKPVLQMHRVGSVGPDSSTNIQFPALTEYLHEMKNRWE
ncbi:hypothetical protein FX982_04432 [Pseudomonas graminis]|uniref:Uncharacterized protein n=1 Tax=Pseudomonas graminis TaxID=158627 RepID=A0A6M8MF96_9PSED|nr:hypothetical protein FX982_04432 [Pseudomonas graminis]